MRIAGLLARCARSVPAARQKLVLQQSALSLAHATGRSMSSGKRVWNVYLSGEIHSDWRDVIKQGITNRNLPIELTSPNLSHEDSDDCGAIILGDEAVRMNYDNKGARMNLIRTRTLLEEADIVCVRFGDKYRQWNAAFDAGYATAKGIPVITLHPPQLGHMLKEVNAVALAVCEEPMQVVDILDYTITGSLPPPREGNNFVPMQALLSRS